ncbi:bacterioferritin [Methanosarcina horonobensis]|uniref:bacterioferritin n=1 Tax=Methanosarcina horonobensis TaxID=418008 RepID=UPI0022B916F3|nr:bacterioferritin [Methanosarcina horonobensis]
MKGDQKLIDCLNARLADELAAINQYFVHAEMCENWNYDRLGDVIEKRAITEMRHAEKLIERILFLEGKPIVSNLSEIRIGGQVPEMHDHDHWAEEEAIKGYNQAIRLAAELGDNDTKVLLESILKEETEHIDWIEARWTRSTR